MFLIPEYSWEMRGRAYTSDDYGKHNRGIFATAPIRAGTIIGDYLGLLIPNEREADYETGRDVYLMYYDERVSIWPDQTQPGIHIINHSCEPNCGIVTHRGHSLYVALRRIHADEEITVSYLLGPLDDECAPCRHRCACRARTCTGVMHLPIDRYVAWRQFDDRQSARTQPEPAEAYQLLQPLDRYPRSVPDGGFHGIFASPEQPPLVRRDDRLPDVASLRRDLRRTGRRLSYPRLGLTVLSVEGAIITLESS